MFEKYIETDRLKLPTKELQYYSSYRVFCKNYTTGVEVECESHRQAERETGVNIGVIASRVSDGTQMLCKGEWAFKSSPTQPWRIIEDLGTEKMR